MEREAPDKRFFKHDVFISYAHADNVDGEVPALHAQLEEFLSLSLEWEPSIWVDYQALNTKADLETQIREGLRDAAVFMAVGSEVIASREWCRNEMGWFGQGARFERVNVERLFPIFLPFADRSRLPPWAQNDLRMGDAPFVLDPGRRELRRDQDWEAHGTYWDGLYRYFDRVRYGIMAAHSAWRLVVESPRGMDGSGSGGETV
jgi:hypothetical protein